MADSNCYIARLKKFGRGVSSLFRRQQGTRGTNRRKVHKHLDHHFIAKPTTSPRRSKAQLQDLKSFLAEQLRRIDEVERNEAIVTQQKKKLACELIKGSPLSPLDNPELLEAIEKKEAALATIRQAQVEGDRAAQEELSLFEDILGDLNDETVTPAFKTALEELVTAMKAQRDAEKQLEELAARVEILQARLTGSAEQERHGFGKRGFCTQPLKDELARLQKGIKLLQETQDLYNHAVCERSQALFTLRATRDWANGKPVSLLRSNELYDRFTKTLEIQRKNLWNIRMNYHRILKEGLQAGRRPESIANQHYLDVQQRTRWIKGAKFHLKKNRDQALAQGADLLPLPELYGDDPITEPAGTLAGDGYTATLGSREMEHVRDTLDRARIEDWRSAVAAATTDNSALDWVEAPPSEVDRLSDMEQESEFDSEDPGIPVQRSLCGSDRLSDWVLPNESHSVREKRGNIRRKISMFQKSRATQRQITLRGD